MQQVRFSMEHCHNFQSTSIQKIGDHYTDQQEHKTKTKVW